METNAINDREHAGIRSLLFFSVNALLAKVITERYFDGIFKVWCAPNYDHPTNPPSSNPKIRYERLKEDVRGEDAHSNLIGEIRAGLTKAILEKRTKYKLPLKDYNDAMAMVFAAKISAFMPLIYVIPNTPEIKIRPAKIEEMADVLSEEYIIYDLTGKYFNVIRL